jgi:hypothetical protein
MANDTVTYDGSIRLNITQFQPSTSIAALVIEPDGKTIRIGDKFKAVRVDGEWDLLYQDATKQYEDWGFPDEQEAFYIVLDALRSLHCSMTGKKVED